MCVLDIITTNSKDAFIGPVGLEIVTADPLTRILQLICQSCLKAVLLWQVLLHLLTGHKCISEQLELVFFNLEQVL